MHVEVISNREGPITSQKIARIVCPIGDLGVHTDQALRYAVALARAFHSKLFLLHCLTVANTAEKERAASIIDQMICPQLILSDPCSIEYRTIVVTGNATDSILRESLIKEADLIVMSTELPMISAALLGSTVSKVCRGAICPVLVLHAGENEWVGYSTGQIDMRRLLVAHDFSPCADRVFEYALTFARQFSAELHLLNILPQKATRPRHKLTGLARHQALNRLEKLRDRLDCHDITTKISVRTGSVQKEICAYAVEQQIDMICLGAHSKSSTLDRLLGRHVEPVLINSPVPVLITGVFP